MGSTSCILVDELRDAAPGIQDIFLRTLRGIKHIQHLTAIKSIVAAGTSSTVHLTTSTSTLAPFNTSSAVQTPTLAFKKRDSSSRCVVDDIWEKSKGYACLSDSALWFTSLLKHPGMVCLWGRVVFEILKFLSISFSNWQRCLQWHTPALTQIHFTRTCRCLANKF